MHFFYSDNQPFRSNKPFRASDYDADVQISKHLENWFYLRFIQTQTDDLVERHQATKELTICDRKIEFWKRQGYSMDRFVSSVKRFQTLYDHRVTYTKNPNFKHMHIKFINKKGEKVQ